MPGKRNFRKNYKVKKVNKDKKQDRQISKINKALRGEFRSSSINQNTLTLLPAGGTILSSGNLIGVGDTTNFREGESITVWQLVARFVFVPTQSPGVNNGNLIRLIGYIDHQCNGASTPGQYVLDDVATATGAIVSPLSFIGAKPGREGYGNAKRVTVFYDKVVSTTLSDSFTTQALVTASQLPMKHVMIRKKFPKGLKIDYIDSGATITSVSTNNIQWAIYSLQNNSTEYLFNSAIKFTP